MLEEDLIMGSNVATKLTSYEEESHPSSATVAKKTGSEPGFADESSFGEDGPPTKRIRPLQLAAALKRVADDFEAAERSAPPPVTSTQKVAAFQPFNANAKEKTTEDFDLSDLADDDERFESTVTVSAEENRRLLARAFRVVDQDVLAETLDAIAQPIDPRDAKEEALVLQAPAALHAPEPSPDSTPELYPALLVPPTPPANDLPFVSYSPNLPHRLPVHGPRPASGIRFRLTPEMKTAVIAARVASQRDVEARRAYVLVGVIWLLALASMATLAYFVMTHQA